MDELFNITGVEEALPKELDDILRGFDFEEGGGIVIDSFQFFENNLYLKFNIKFLSDTPHQLWQVTAFDIKEEKINIEWITNIGIYSQHILLLEYHENSTELYFNGTTANSQELFMDITQSLLKLSDWKYTSRYFYSPDSIAVLSKQEYGLFARGPKTILNIYQQCLIKQGIKANFIGDYQNAINEQELKLFTLGNSYIIGREFLFERLK